MTVRIHLIMREIQDSLFGSGEESLQISDILCVMGQRGGAILKLLLTLVFGGALVYGVVVALDPWALHIGGRFTPLLTWQGSGRLLTKSGAVYPMYISFFPSSHFSRLHMDGLRPTGGTQGNGWLCTAPGQTVRLTLSGTIYGAWRSTEDSLMAFRVVEFQNFNVGQRQGYFDLIGRWRGPELVMDGRTTVGGTFNSGLRIEHPSVTFNWGSYSDFKAVCANSAQR
jgi:hypothetical protein